MLQLQTGIPVEEVTFHETIRGEYPKLTVVFLQSSTASCRLLRFNHEETENIPWKILVLSKHPLSEVVTKEESASYELC